MDRPRILIVENSVAATGAFNSILRSSVYLSDQFEFIFLIPTGSRVAETVYENNFKAIEFPFFEIRRNLLSIALYFPLLLINTFRFKRLLRNERIALIICNDFYNLLPAMGIAFGARVFYLCYVRFLPSKFPSALVKFWFAIHRRFAKRIIAVSQAVERELPRDGKVTIIHNELPGELVSYSPSSNKLLLYPANFIEGKGHEHALKAFGALHHRFPEWKLRFIGGDMGLEKNRRYHVHLEEIARAQRLQDKIEWQSFKNNPKADYLESAIVLIFSDSESFSMVCLEGSFYGRAVIATRCGGPPEIIEDRKSGILVEIKDVDSMIAAMDLLMNSAEIRENMGKDGFWRVREKFHNQQTSEKLGALYKDLIK